jgi:branched-subunit amino acid transport protein AzlD
MPFRTTEPGEYVRFLNVQLPASCGFILCLFCLHCSNNVLNGALGLKKYATSIYTLIVETSIRFLKKQTQIDVN